ncbi:putative L-sorbosone dehydrogenase [Gluconacetobacter diazotrophicus PA1 5]|uniref:Sorbosone dehydrogenase family protein n=2 Tax=Gluconacetobacter diazotrophicus TaxID=33996 RepID=A0A7W4I8B0_GLUDI|nr:sorbosone dehydrogenase family protein [Gluconacetobacter diazotrophicus]ACI52381.1 putative L-sorbosone dehydrogenase [Gluconacetobacter diazotrophicus PA1 5]MBB2158075.1 sorbosone dehydrogenase family protein [Gluconacetobacter diazotrophicus]TWB05522.1 glucose/arabinose dehydrogenase [Gluconacetobacter diazotrophicus]
MRRSRIWVLGGGAALVLLLLAGCYRMAARPEQATLTLAAGTGAHPLLPPPNPTLLPTVNIATPVGWAAGATPRVVPGLAVAAFATGLDHPRWLYRLPNGDILVAESNSPMTDITTLKNRIARFVMGAVGAGDKSPDRIILLRDSTGRGVADQRTVFLDHLRSPFGMALVGDTLYVANADSLVRFPYQTGQTRIDAPGTRVIDLPAGYNHHWTKNILASPDGSALYITVGSNSNVAEHGMAVEEGRARIDRFDIATGTLRPFATGLRNPNGLAWNPQTGALWTAVNERDEIGSDLVPDYITAVQEGAFYGWPYSYYGQHVDVRVTPQRPDLVAQAIAPDYALGPHTASLGIAFSQASTLPEAWRHGLFVAQHGSWNRWPKSGYRVIYVPFVDGAPVEEPREVLTGFLTADEKHVHGRPVGLALDGTGALLVADDVGNTVWRVTGAPGMPQGQ